MEDSQTKMQAENKEKIKQENEVNKRSCANQKIMTKNLQELHLSQTQVERVSDHFVPTIACSSQQHVYTHGQQMG